MLDAPANILHFWRLVEWLTPTAFPKPAPGRDERNPAYTITPGEGLPWDAEHPHCRHRCIQGSPRRVANGHGREWAYAVYAGPLDQNAAREDIETWLDDPVENVVRDERTPQDTAAIGFQVTGDGKVVADSLVVSTYVWAYGKLREIRASGGTSLQVEAVTVEAFEKAEQEIAERFAAELAGVRVTAKDLDEFLRWLFARLSLPTTKVRTYRGVVKGTMIQAPKKPAAKPSIEDEEGEEDPADNASEAVPKLSAELEMLNSHFRDDLALIGEAAKGGDVGAALSQYLGRRPKRQVDVRADHDEAWKLLRPTMYPRGRWPGEGRHPLVFSQQLAVNHAFQALGNGKSGLVAVNGPPGTGKTTLLKDVIAEIIVSRAQVLAQYTQPKDAFRSAQIAWESNNWQQRYARIDPTLQGFGIVVASSNNGAVENVTLELPKADDVDPDLGSRSSPFTALGSAMLPEGEEAWSLVAAVLGKKKNRDAFADAFWGQEGRDNGGHPKAHTILKAKDAPGILTWTEAVSRFEGALSREARVRADRDALYKASSRVMACHKAYTDADAKAKALGGPLEEVGIQLADAQKRTARDEAAWRAERDQIKAEAMAQQKLIQDELKMEKRRLEQVNQEVSDCGSRIVAHQRKKPGKLIRWFARHVVETPGVRVWREKLEELEASSHEVKRRAAGVSRSRNKAAEKLKEAKRKSANRAVDAQCREAHERYLRAKETLDQLEAREAQLRDDYNALDTSARKNLKAYRAAAKKLESYQARFGAGKVVSPEAVREAPASKEVLAPWGDEEWEEARVNVFVAALDLHDAFVYAAGTPLQHNLRGMMKLLRGEAPHDIPPGVAQTLWASLFLMVPVVSTTFASFGRQFRHLGREEIGWLLVDEAGQAAPQYAAGALWRAKSALIVGDPKQLTPVVTVPDRLQSVLAESSGVSMGWRPGATSAQALADAASSHGSWLGETWVGAPLLVHRRCNSPMFEISNAVAYDNAMVHGKPKKPSHLPPSGWLHVPASDAQGHWIPAEGQAVRHLVESLAEAGVAFEDIFMISPFRSVVSELHGIARQYQGIKAGTIHTVQGKEAQVVILVLGGNPGKEGAKRWASGSPNLVNVAVSRAKTRLYVVGDEHAWQRYPFFDDCSALLALPELENVQAT